MPLFYEEKYNYRFRREIHPQDFPLHIHNAVEICIMTAGSCQILYENRRYDLAAGDIFFAFPNQPHGYEGNTDTERYMLILPMKPYLQMFANKLTDCLPEQPILRKGTWEHLDILPLVMQACKDAQASSREVMQGYFAVIIGKLLSLLNLKKADNDSDNILRATLMYLHAHYREPITRKDIARAIGYHESYISHVFSQVLHTGITQYVQTLRVDEASNLLLHTKDSITKIATDTGFGSIRNFNRVFQKATGMTPKEYRKK